MDEQIRRAKQRITDVRHDDRVVGQESVQPLEEPFDRDLFVTRRFLDGRQQFRPFEFYTATRFLNLSLQQPAQKIFEPHAFEIVIANGDFFARR